jgi:Zn-dependent peptidase ImmA (M78 family)/transcriptional regulator with XRE-family HTH domain
MSQTVHINNILLAEAVSSAEESIWNIFPALQQWISGDKQPTVNQLAELAKKVNIPFGYFFLKELPKKEYLVPLFRTVEVNPIYHYSPELAETIAVVETRQDWLSEFLRSEGHEPLNFVGSVTDQDHVDDITHKIRTTLNLPTNWAKHLTSRDEALIYLLNKIEDVGIYVIMNGIVRNSTKKALNPLEFKGFTMCDPYAPFIFINRQDFKAAQIFTLLHELVHVWLGISAVSELDQMQPPANNQEKICDAVAAALLVDESELRTGWQKVKHQSNGIELLVKQFKVSSVVIGRRLLDIGIFNWREYIQFYKSEKRKWESGAQKGGGGDFYLNQPNRVGRAFFKMVDYATRSGKLLYSDAYKLTNLYGETYHNFQSKY